jgi:hypothetical protein
MIRILLMTKVIQTEAHLRIASNRKNLDEIIMEESLKFWALNNLKLINISYEMPGGMWH